MAPSVRVLRVAAFAMLFTWFGVAALDHPSRLRVPMLAVGLRWLAPVMPAPGAKPTLPLLGVLVVAGRALAVGIAIALLLVVLNRRSGMVVGAVRAGVAGRTLLAVAWGNMVETGLARLAGLLRPALLAYAILSAPFGLPLLAGMALVAFAAAQAPAAPSQQGRTASGVPLPRAHAVTQNLTRLAQAPRLRPARNCESRVVRLLFGSENRPGRTKATEQEGARRGG